RSKISVPGPGGNAGDPARHGTFLPCPVPVTPDTGALSYGSPPRAGESPVWREARKAIREHVPFWLAARNGRESGLAAWPRIRDTRDAERWPHLIRAWDTDTDTFAAICEEAS